MDNNLHEVDSDTSRADDARRSGPLSDDDGVGAMPSFEEEVDQAEDDKAGGADEGGGMGSSEEHCGEGVSQGGSDELVQGNLEEAAAEVLDSRVVQCSAVGEVGTLLQDCTMLAKLLKCPAISLHLAC